MNILLDTHVFLWSKNNDPRMSSRAWELLHSDDNQLFLSAASVAEISVKTSIGKLDLKLPIDRFVLEGMANAEVSEMPLRVSHALRMNQLPLHHRDPFDRLNLATAIEEDMHLLSDDSQFAKYDVQLIW